MIYASEDQPGPPEYYKPCLSAYIYYNYNTISAYNTFLFWSPIETPKNSEMQGQILSTFRQTNVTHNFVIVKYFLSLLHIRTI